MCEKGSEVVVVVRRQSIDRLGSFSIKRKLLLTAVLLLQLGGALLDEELSSVYMCGVVCAGMGRVSRSSVDTRRASLGLGA